jgi:hypothetical protein
LAYAARKKDPIPLVADIFPAHKRISYNKETAEKIMDDGNRDIAIFIITHMIMTCRAIIIQGYDGKKILPSVFRSMGLVGVVLSDKVIQHFVPDYSCHRAEYSMEADFPAYLTFNKKTRKTCFILTCPQIRSSLVRPGITKYEIKFWTRVTHLFVSVFLEITGAKYRQEYFPEFTSVEESVLSILNTKKGASNHMKLIVKSGQLSNVVIFKAPRQIGGGKGGKASLGKPKSGSTEWYVTEEVNPVNKMPLSEKESRFVNTKRKAAAQLVFEGAVPSFKSCTAYIISWTKEANDTKSKTIFIQGKDKAKGRLWKLIIVSEEPEDITAVDDEMYKEMSAQLRKADAQYVTGKRKFAWRVR